jgi:GTP cyclohydrolase I
MSQEQKPLVDITSMDLASISSPLQWVGMEGISIPLLFDAGGECPHVLNAKADAFVSIDTPDTKGIHMSRLYTRLAAVSETPLNHESVHTLLRGFVESQKGISQSARVALHFDLLLKKPALLSDEAGYQSYPVTISSDYKEGACGHTVKLSIPYSSTCPCSAALSRQLLAEALDSAFPTDQVDKHTLLEWVRSLNGSVATPHSQRSFASVTLALKPNQWLFIPAVIKQIETVLGTAVQTAVKRQDEQEFARLNAINLMFCEDAARKVKAYVQTLSAVQSYMLKVDHQESLHPHNAVAMDASFSSPFH